MKTTMFARQYRRRWLTCVLPVIVATLTLAWPAPAEATLTYASQNRRHRTNVTYVNNNNNGYYYRSGRRYQRRTMNVSRGRRLSYGDDPNRGRRRPRNVTYNNRYHR